VCRKFLSSRNTGNTETVEEELLKLKCGFVLYFYQGQMPKIESECKPLGSAAAAAAAAATAASYFAAQQAK
jgi:hypothetical protein